MCFERSLRRTPEIGAVRDLRKPQEVEHRNRIPRGEGAVGIVLPAEKQRLVINRIQIERAARPIFEDGPLMAGQADRGLEVTEFELGFVKIEKRLGKEGVVFEEAWNGRRAMDA